MNLAAVLSLQAGGPGSGRQAKGLNKWKDAKTETKNARKDPKQTSFYGPGHTKELQKIKATVVKRGSQHCVESHTGKNLGCSPTEGGAKKRLAQVEYFKHVKAGGPGSGPHPEGGVGKFKETKISHGRQALGDNKDFKTRDRAIKNRLEWHFKRTNELISQGMPKDKASAKAFFELTGKKNPLTLNDISPIKSPVKSASEGAEPPQTGVYGHSRGTDRKFTEGPKSLKGLKSNGAMYIDPIAPFHPPSLKNAKRVPTDDPRETDDSLMDVTKRKEAKEQRMKLLKTQIPSGNPPQMPIRTTAIAHHTAGSLPGIAASIVSRRRRHGGMFRAYGAARI